MKYLFSLLFLISTVVLATPSADCVPVTPDPHTQGFWRHVARKTHPSGEHENLPGYLSCVQATATFSSVNSVAKISDELNPNPANSKQEQARSQFMAMVLNLCSGRVAACNCILDPDLGQHTMAELIAIVDKLLSKPSRTNADYLLAQAVADRINNGTSMVECPISQVPPHCGNDQYATDWDTSLVVGAPGVLGNDSASNGHTLTATLENAPLHGNVVLNANGSFTYVPAQYESGEDSFVYRVWDGTVYNTCIAYIDVTEGSAPPAPPVCQDDTYSTDWDTELLIVAPGLLANDSDPNGDELVAGITTAPTHGSVIVNEDGSFLYSPEAYFSGVVTFGYQVCDGVFCSSCIATINVTPGLPPQQAPVCQEDVYSISWNEPLTSSAPGVLINDSDPDGDDLTAALASGPSSGQLVLNDDGSFVYTPVAGFVGQVSFVYLVSDGGRTSSCTATINVTTAPGPQMLPVCQDDYYTTNWDTNLVVSAPGLLANDYDPNANTLTAHLHSGPAIGQLYLNQNGSFTYVPVQGQAGVVSFVYRAWDGYGYSLCTAYINVTVGNLAPVCGPESYTVTAGTRLVVAAPGVLGNDYDPEGAPLTAYGTTIIPSVGKLGLNADGSFWYDAPAGYTGTVNFVYKAGDGISKTSCTVYITVVP